MPKIIDIKLRKEQIMQEAIQVFIEEGYHKTKLHQIAERCNIGRTTIYKYFKNKNDIFNCAINNVFDLLENDYKIITAKSHASQLDKIKAYIGKILEDCYEKKSLLIMLIDLWLRIKRENNEFVTKIKKRASEIQEVFEKLLHEGIDKREIKPVNVKSMAFTLFSLVESFVIQASFADELTLTESLASVNVLLDGLKA
jgi:AcrR family transcriptional regulator